MVTPVVVDGAGAPNAVEVQIENQNSHELTTNNNSKYENTNNSDSSATLTSKYFNVEVLLTLMGISIAAILGSLMRFGMLYYRVWRTDTNYCIMYTQMLGCFIMGWIQTQKAYMMAQSKCRAYRVLYVAIASGLCGSITTFSTWMIECNKSLYLQANFNDGLFASYNGGKILEWGTCQVTGVGVPLVALRLGQFVGALQVDAVANRREQGLDVAEAQVVGERPVLEAAIAVSAVMCLLVVVLVPALAYPSWVAISYTAVLGIAGAYLRYQLSFLNPHWPNLPLGTLVANLSGTWLLAAFTVLSRFVVPYYSVSIQAVLLGLGTGFCGCLTTVSTLVAELDALPAKYSYIYGLLSCVVAQMGIVLVLNAYSAATLPQSLIGARAQPTTDLCEASYAVCAQLLESIACPLAQQTNVACIDMNTGYAYSSFQGLCMCGNGSAALNTSRPVWTVVTALLSRNLSKSSVGTWPTAPMNSAAPTETTDYCLSFENTCDDLLNKIGCPVSQRFISGCDRRGLSYAVSRCDCAALPAGPTLQTLLVAGSLLNGRDLLSFAGYPTQTSIDLCSAFSHACSLALDHIQAPASIRQACKLSGNYSTWVGTCRTGASAGASLDIGQTVVNSLFDAIVLPRAYGLLVRLQNSSSHITSELAQATSNITKWDACSSYKQLCTAFLAQIQCPLALQTLTVVSSSCGPVRYRQESFDRVGVCKCGSIAVSGHVLDVLVDQVTSLTVQTRYLRIPSSHDPYVASVTSNPYSQITSPSCTLPQ